VPGTSTASTAKPRSRDAGFDLALGLLGWMLDGLNSDARQRAQQQLRHTIDAHTGADGVTFAAAVWLITGRRGAVYR
jgi:hypothetical protein